MIAEVTPTISTSAYAADDQVGAVQTLNVDPGVRRLVSITVIDKAKQKAELEFLLFKELPTVASADNAACNVADAEIAAKCIGVVTLAATDYTDLSAGAVGTVQCDVVVQTTGSKLYALAKTTGTPTYVSTSDLVVKYGLL